MCKLGDTSTKKVEVLPVEVLLVGAMPLEVMDSRSIACRSKSGRSNAYAPFWIYEGYRFTTF